MPSVAEFKKLIDNLSCDSDFKKTFNLLIYLLSLSSKTSNKLCEITVTDRICVGELNKRIKEAKLSESDQNDIDTHINRRMNECQKNIDSNMIIPSYEDSTYFPLWRNFENRALIKNNLFNQQKKQIDEKKKIQIYIFLWRWSYI